jgi:hypothetical protein
MKHYASTNLNLSKKLENFIQKDFEINEISACKKLEKATTKCSYVIRHNSESDTIELSAAGYMAFKELLRKHLDNAPNKSLYNIRESWDLNGKIVDMCIKFNGEKPYTVNMYNTTCLAMINGPGYKNFRKIIEKIFDVLDTKIEYLNTLNHTILTQIQKKRAEIETASNVRRSQRHRIKKSPWDPSLNPSMDQQEDTGKSTKSAPLQLLSAAEGDQDAGRDGSGVTHIDIVQEDQGLGATDTDRTASVSCSFCDKLVENNDNALECTECLSWIHTHCDNVSRLEYERHQDDQQLRYLCSLCKADTDNEAYDKEQNLNNDTSNEENPILDTTSPTVLKTTGQTDLLHNIPVGADPRCHSDNYVDLTKAEPQNLPTSDLNIDLSTEQVEKQEAAAPERTEPTLNTPQITINADPKDGKTVRKRNTTKVITSESTKSISTTRTSAKKPDSTNADIKKQDVLLPVRNDPTLNICHPSILEEHEVARPRTYSTTNQKTAPTSRKTTKKIDLATANVEEQDMLMPVRTDSTLNTHHLPMLEEHEVVRPKTCENATSNLPNINEMQPNDKTQKQKTRNLKKWENNLKQETENITEITSKLAAARVHIAKIEYQQKQENISQSLHGKLRQENPPMPHQLPNLPPLPTAMQHVIPPPGYHTSEPQTNADCLQYSQPPLNNQHHCAHQCSQHPLQHPAGHQQYLQQHPVPVRTGCSHQCQTVHTPDVETRFQIQEVKHQLEILKLQNQFVLEKLNSTTQMSQQTSPNIYVLPSQPLPAPHPYMPLFGQHHAAMGQHAYSGPPYALNHPQYMTGHIHPQYMAGAHMHAFNQQQQHRHAIGRENGVQARPPQQYIYPQQRVTERNDHQTHQNRRPGHNRSRPENSTEQTLVKPDDTKYYKPSIEIIGTNKSGPNDRPQFQALSSRRIPPMDSPPLIDGCEQSHSPYDSEKAIPLPPPPPRIVTSTNTGSTELSQSPSLYHSEKAISAPSPSPRNVKSTSSAPTEMSHAKVKTYDSTSSMNGEILSPHNRLPTKTANTMQLKDPSFLELANLSPERI